MMPGASRVSMYAVPSPSGSCAICLASTVMPLMPVVVLSVDVSARTSTVSDMPPGVSVKSTRVVSPTVTWAAGCDIFLKP